MATGLNADRVDSHDASDFAMAADFLTAAVALPAARRADRDRPRRHRRRPPTPATKSATVTFNRDVSKCTYTASPTGGRRRRSPRASRRPPGNVNAVTVSFNTGTGALTVPFYLQVVC